MMVPSLKFLGYFINEHLTFKHALTFWFGQAQISSTFVWFT